MIAHDYAKALFELDTPDLKRLRDVLARRGHTKLLSSIFNEYQKLALGKKRSEMHAKVTPEKERTRVLLELYKKLVSQK